MHNEHTWLPPQFHSSDHEGIKRYKLIKTQGIGEEAPADMKCTHQMDRKMMDQQKLNCFLHSAKGRGKGASRSPTIGTINPGKAKEWRDLEPLKEVGRQGQNTGGLVTTYRRSMGDHDSQLQAAWPLLLLQVFFEEH